MRTEASRLKPPLACQVSMSSTVCSSSMPRRRKQAEHAALQRALEAEDVVGREVRRLVEGDAASERAR